MTPTQSVFCTVFERDYHLGVGALANSLYHQGYRGVLYAGYRGPLPPWTNGISPDASGTAIYDVAEGMSIHFVRQGTDEMLANIKPQLIEQVWERFGDTIENVFYIDCDIVVKAAPKHFEEWARGGVALCEDMNSPVHTSHPLRRQWAEYYAGFGIDYVPKDDVYVNGGFVGINRRYRDFAGLWKTIQEHMKLNTGRQDRIGIADRWNMFHFMDQDALNVAKDLTEHVSIMGRDAMDFGKFGYVMSHAAGRSKPWQKNYLRNLISTGQRPGFADKLYWQHVSHPIRLFPESKAERKRMAIRTASFLSRFFTRT
ncbi:hypothetical protein [Lewinella sp. IMCC34183]|uniref:hypothetical protein n=1 Tax=Lewinella sp. IMCC34183 TaxID=2248762 RepID=UPI000E246FE3|nr:hypothetical protein [Lewinella sp. IMCC34183]